MRGPRKVLIRVAAATHRAPGPTPRSVKLGAVVELVRQRGAGASPHPPGRGVTLVPRKKPSIQPPDPATPTATLPRFVEGESDYGRTGHNKNSAVPRRRDPSVHAPRAFPPKHWRDDSCTECDRSAEHPSNRSKPQLVRGRVHPRESVAEVHLVVFPKLGFGFTHLVKPRGHPRKQPLPQYLGDYR